MTSDLSSSSYAPKHIHVLLVDDSAVIRGALTRMIEGDAAIKIVGSVSNGELGITMAERKKPHIVIMDIEMPVMDGLTALPRILAASPSTKVIMFSSLTEKGATATLKAFSLGAVECLAKPNSSTAIGEGSDFQKNILSLLKNLVPERLRIAGDDIPALRPAPLTVHEHTTVTLRKDAAAYKGKPSIVAIGSSTGGPQALFTVTKHLKGLDVPIVITQHMPATFTKILAEHITQQSGIPTFEGADDMLVEAGKAYVAPGGHHMKIIRDGTVLKVRLDNGPPENFCKPAVDPMFRSVIELYGSKVLGVILTGMGSDGLNGGKSLIEKGGRLIAQDEATSVVWGMPGAVARAGICNEVLPIQDIGPWIRKAVLG